MKKNSSVQLISTIVVALLAIALAIVAVITLNNNNSNPTQSTVSSSAPEVFRPTQELVDECTYAAHDLIAGNYQIVRLFVTEGLPHYDEPYGNLPEDGIYTVNSTDYTSLTQIEELVKSFYTSTEANRILTNIDGNGLAVYKNREILADVVTTEAEGTAESTSETSSRPVYKTETVLGISAEFKPDTEYAKDWSSCRIAVIPKSENECELNVYLDGLDENTVTSENADSVLDVAMVKVNGEWRLANFVY